MQWNEKRHPLRKLFGGLVESALCVEVGLCDPELTEYLVGLLIEFIHVDSLYRFTDNEGRALQSVASMAEAVEGEDVHGRPMNRRDMHRYIGDYALFWAGVFPEQIGRQETGINPDGYVVYVDRGKESYGIASHLFDDNSDPPRSVLKLLSREFEVCAHGLGLVRRGWEQQKFRDSGDGHLLY